jgi:hypothetical protein
MKRPWQGIQSTHRVPKVPSQPFAHVKDHSAHSSADTPDNNDNISSNIIPVHDTHPNIIEDDDESDGGNVFVFAAFADKCIGTLYSDLTRAFPFMSLEENVCFFVVYHYKSNTILAVPIPNFMDESILMAYQTQLELLETKGHKIQLNVMDNQACNVVKTYLATKGCHNVIVEPNNHRANAAEQAIQTFKAHFISALATTDSNFPLQLWDCLTPHVTATLNM